MINFKRLALASLIWLVGSQAILAESDTAPSTDQAKAAPSPWKSKYASELYNFAVQDAVLGPNECGTLFVGSSSIRFWYTLEDDFPNLTTKNRGFGGSQISDIVDFFDIVMAPHKPREIVFYAGENDISAGVPPKDVVERFKAFMRLKDEAFAQTPVYFVSVKPSIARFDELPAQTEVNEMMVKLAETRDDLFFVDIASGMMQDGSPKPIFIFDKLHMNKDGYAIWLEILSGYLGNPNRPVAAACKQ